MKNKQFETLKAGLGNGLVCEYLPISKKNLRGELLTIDFDDHDDYWIRLDVMDKPRTPKFAKPHLFPLSMLTKPITVKGYNDNEPSVQMYKLTTRTQEDIKSGGMNVKWWSLMDIEYLHSIHFNVFNLDEDQFINAAESKVYQN